MTLRQFYKDYFEEDPGCIDHSCRFGPPGGMGTNGGCRCDEHEALRQMGKLANFLLQQLEQHGKI